MFFKDQSNKTLKLLQTNYWHIFRGSRSLQTAIYDFNATWRLRLPIWL